MSRICLINIPIPIYRISRHLYLSSPPNCAYLVYPHFLCEEPFLTQHAWKGSLSFAPGRLTSLHVIPDHISYRTTAPTAHAPRVDVYAGIAMEVETLTPRRPHRSVSGTRYFCPCAHPGRQDWYRIFPYSGFFQSSSPAVHTRCGTRAWLACSRRLRVDDRRGLLVTWHLQRVEALLRVSCSLPTVCAA